MHEQVKSLGANVAQLLPVQRFDEFRRDFQDKIERLDASTSSALEQAGRALSESRDTLAKSAGLPTREEIVELRSELASFRTTVETLSKRLSELEDTSTGQQPR